MCVCVPISQMITTTVAETHGTTEPTGLSLLDVMRESTVGPLSLGKLNFRPSKDEYSASTSLSTSVKVDMDALKDEDTYINEFRVNAIKLKDVLLSYCKEPNEYNAMFTWITTEKESRGVYMISLNCTLYHIV